jgi:hypothetical protein
MARRGGPPACRFAAFALAMEAKAGRLAKAEAAALLIQAAREVGPDSPDYRAIRDFAQAVTAPGATRPRIEEAAGALLAAIDRLNVPVPPDVAAGRADIHG